MNLLHRGVVIDTYCETCNTHKETLVHCLLECNISRLYWFGSNLGFRLKHGSYRNFGEWFQEIWKLEETEIIEKVCMLAWSIWKMRNTIHFEHKHPDPIKGILYSFDLLSNYQNYSSTHANQSTAKESSWHPPPNNCYKINTDAANILESLWGRGVIIRNAEGMPIIAAFKRTSTANTVEEAEALAVLYGLQLAGDLHTTNVHIESDCLPLVHAFHGKQQLLNSLGLLIEEIQNYRPCFNLFRYVPRQCNQVAHHLAQLAKASPLETVMFQEVPVGIEHLLVSDRLVLLQ